MKAIVTKYHGPTNTRGSRVSASDLDGNRVTLSWDHALNSEQNHDDAARALCCKMGWSGRLVSGGLKNGNVYAFDPLAPKMQGTIIAGSIPDQNLAGCTT